MINLGLKQRNIRSAFTSYDRLMRDQKLSEYRQEYQKVSVGEILYIEVKYAEERNAIDPYKWVLSARCFAKVVSVTLPQSGMFWRYGSIKLQMPSGRIVSLLSDVYHDQYSDEFYSEVMKTPLACGGINSDISIYSFQGDMIALKQKMEEVQIAIDQKKRREQYAAQERAQQAQLIVQREREMEQERLLRQKENAAAAKDVEDLFWKFR